MVTHNLFQIIIKDTKSMHGTFVNGLQLLEDETAELRQGTEVTFGCEVTRGEEVFPPKTFRCEVEWEVMTYVWLYFHIHMLCLSAQLILAVHQMLPASARPIKRLLVAATV